VTGTISSSQRTDAYTLTPETTLRDVINTLPAECFQKKPLRAWWGVFYNAVAVAVGYVLVAYSPWYLLPFSCFFLGTALTGFFVLTHDCGHRSFSDKLWVNDLMGHILSLPVLYPFHCWRIKHDHHHAHTNKMTEDNAWAPLTIERYESSPKSFQVFYRLIRTRFWWIGSIVHWAGMHFDPNLYAERQRKQVRFSIGLVLVFSAIFLPTLAITTGITGLIKFFLLPWLVYHFWMSTFTLLHHTIPEIPFKYPDQWHGATAQLAGTVHCQYPWWFEWLCHDINVHIPHHVTTSIPCYNLRLAHASFEQNWGQYLHKNKFSWALLKEIGDKCHLYDEEKGYQSFDEAEAKIKAQASA